MQYLQFVHVRIKRDHLFSVIGCVCGVRTSLAHLFIAFHRVSGVVKGLNRSSKTGCFHSSYYLPIFTLRILMDFKSSTPHCVQLVTDWFCDI